MLNGVLTWESGSIRFYDCPVELAHALYDACAEYAYSLHFTLIDDHIAKLGEMRGSGRIGRGDFIRFLQLLQAHGIRHLIAKRARGRRLPFATMIQDGVLAGWWHVDIAHVLP